MVSLFSPTVTITSCYFLEIPIPFCRHWLRTCASRAGKRHKSPSIRLLFVAPSLSPSPLENPNPNPMLSTAMRTVSSSPWRSRGHLDSVISGYDRIEKTYVRRRKMAENQPGSEVAMASSPPSEELKTCADCRTSLTPLWRKGPYGPKVLLHLAPPPSSLGF